MNRFRPAAALVLALVLALTSGAMAVARGQTSAVGTLVLCVGDGLVSVAVDAEGQPSGPAHICPDCALSLFAAQAVPPLGVARPVVASHRVQAPAEAPRPAARRLTAHAARGPPFPT